MIRISKRFWRYAFVKILHRCNTNYYEQHLGPIGGSYQQMRKIVIRVGNSDDGLTQSCPPQNCPPVGISEVSNSDIHLWDYLKWNIFEIEISLTMKDPWGGVNKMQIQMWCRTLRQIGRAPCTTAISNREHWACIVYRPSVYCTITYKCFSLKITFFHCFFLLLQKVCI